MEDTTLSTQRHMPTSQTARPPRGPRLGLLAPLRFRDFRLLSTAMAISLLGDGIYEVTLAWQVYRLSNAPAAFSAVLVAWSLPLVLFVLFGGVVSDRVDRRKVMIVSDAIRALVVAAIAVLSLTGALTLAHLILMAVVYGSAQAFFGPASGSIVPQIVPREDLQQANSLQMFLRPLTWRLLGPALGGFIVGGVGAGWGFMIDGVTFIVSIVTLALMSPLPRSRDAVSDASILHEVREGFRFVRRHTWLWGSLVAVGAMLFVVIGPFEILLPYLVKNELDAGAESLGLIFAAGGVGSIAAAVVMGQRSSPRRWVTFMYVGWIVGVLLIAPYFWVNAPWQAMLLEGAGWAVITAADIVWRTQMQRLVPDELLGRVTSLDWAACTALFPLSYAVTGPVSAALGVRTTFLWSGLLGAGIVGAALFLPGMRSVERNDARSVGSLPQTEDEPARELRSA